MSIREYKSNVFSMLLEEKEYALQVYNALNGTSYEDAEELKIQKLESSIVLTLRNDASFIIDGHLSIYEHQSTYNPNMPLRQLIYFVDLIKPELEKNDMYRKRLIRIATPNFYVFYNGRENRPPFETLHLSDAYMKKEDTPALELTCKVININPGKNDEFLEKCKVLGDYTVFVESVYKRRQSGYPDEDAVMLAINECIENDVLRDFLKRRRNEVLEVMKIDMTYERREVFIREEERAEGRAEGREEGREEGLALGISMGEVAKVVSLACKKLSKGFEIDEIADFLEESPEYIRKIAEIAEKYAPDYDTEKILKELGSK